MCRPPNVAEISGGPGAKRPETATAMLLSWLHFKHRKPDPYLRQRAGPPGTPAPASTRSPAKAGSTCAPMPRRGCASRARSSACSKPSRRSSDMQEQPRWRRYLRFWGPDVAADVDDELRFHLEMRERDFLAA